MGAVELLQQLGLNKYEAEAYYALLSEGPLTGYELGKRSQVPLSRSYEILERLTHKGLALVQPGDPPRYAALEPRHFLGGVRATMETTLAALSGALAGLPLRSTAGEFWVLRGRRVILDRARVMVAAAEHTVEISLPADTGADVEDLAAAVRIQQGQIVRAPTVEVAQGDAGPQAIVLLVDGSRALAGALTPTDRCQAVAGTNMGLIAALRGYFNRRQTPESAVLTAPSDSDRSGWVAWEARKQRRLWRVGTRGDVA